MFTWIKNIWNSLTRSTDQKVKTEEELKDEFKFNFKLGCKKDLKDERDLIKPKLCASNLNITSNFSLRQFAPKVRDQGSTSACGGFAATSAIYILLNKAYNQSSLEEAKLNSITHFIKVPKLSAFYTYWYARYFDNSLPEDCGVTLRSLMKSLKEFGAIPEKHVSSSSGVRTKPKVVKDCNSIKINKYFRIPINDETSEQIKNILLIEQLPIIAGIYLYDSQMYEASKTGYLKPVQDWETAKCIGGHAVCITGFKIENDPETNQPITWYEFQNSWGENTWGDNGYGYIREDMLGHINYMLDIWCFDKSFW